MTCRGARHTGCKRADVGTACLTANWGRGSELGKALLIADATPVETILHRLMADYSYSDPGELGMLQV